MAKEAARSGSPAPVWVLAEFEPGGDRGRRATGAARGEGELRLTAEAREACLVAKWLSGAAGGSVTAWVFAAGTGSPGREAAAGWPTSAGRPVAAYAEAMRGLADEAVLVRHPAFGDLAFRARARAMADSVVRLADGLGGGLADGPAGGSAGSPAGGEPPFAVVFPASANAACLAATLAATLGVGLISHGVELAYDDGHGEAGLEVLVPAFGGLAAITCPQARPVLVSLARGVASRMGLAAAVAGDGRPPRVTELEPAAEARALAAAAPRVAGWKDAPRKAAGGLGAARVIVAGGAGAASPELWGLVTTVGGLLGAPVGATRPAIDAGVASEDQMIGQSGLRVAPELYLAFGLSGDLQHTVGFEGARTVVAVNRDAAAPIFGRADYGIVANLEEFLPSLVEELRRAVANRRAPG